MKILDKIFPAVYDKPKGSSEFFMTDLWIQDIHNGILNTEFAYTGGQSIVPDKDGKLRWTPSGAPSVEGGNWVYTTADGAELGPELWSDPAGLITGGWVYNGDGTYTGTNTTGLLIKYAGIYQQLNGHYRRISFEIISRTAGTVCAVTGGYGTAKSTVGIHEEDLIIGNNNGAGVYGSGFTGTVRVRSMKDIIPKWITPPAASTRAISTKKGSRPIVLSDTFKGMLIEPAMTNKVIARKANPTDLTNTLKTGDAALVVSVVSDSAALAASGLDKICTLGMVYKLDNSAGTTPAYFMPGGQTTNTNPHSASIYCRGVGDAGASYSNYDTDGFVSFNSPSLYTRVSTPGYTPTSTTSTVQVRIPAGGIIYCILPQLEESPFVTSPIIGTDTAAAQTRQAANVSTPTEGIFPMVPEVLGAEVVTNQADREFTSDTGYWTKSTNVSIPGNGLAVLNSVASGDGIRNYSALTVGKLYKITFSIFSISSGGVRPFSGSGTAGTARTTTGTYTEYLWCTTDGRLAFDSTAAGTIATIDNISVKEVIQPAGAQNFAIYQRIVPTYTETGVILIDGWRISSSNYLQILMTSGSLPYIEKVIHGGSAVSISRAVTPTKDTPYDFVFIQTDAGMSAKVRTYSGGTWGAWSTWSTGGDTAMHKTPAVLPSTFYLGSHTGSPTRAINFPRTAIIKLPQKGSLAEYQAWIEAELTRRGLI